jgi:hypothetical protein
MPREQVDWYMKQSLHDRDKIHARQCSTYYSNVNVNKSNCPYLSSFEQEQSWAMSNHHKRYQSSIENIYLTIPYVVTAITPFSNENNKMKTDRSISLLPPLPPTRQHASSSHRFNLDSNTHQQEKQKILSNNTKNSMIKKSGTDSMRIFHMNGEIVVRI